MPKNVVDPAELAKFCAACAEDKLAADVITLHVPQTGIADYYVIGTANSEPQLQALTSFVARQVCEKFHRNARLAGDSASGWVLLDLDSVVVHLMTAANRDKYNLEGLWGREPGPADLEKLSAAEQFTSK